MTISLPKLHNQGLCRRLEPWLCTGGVVFYERWLRVLYRPDQQVLTGLL